MNVKRRSPADWQKLISEQEISGQTASAYCRAKGLDHKFFSKQKNKYAPSEKKFMPVVLSAPRVKETALIWTHNQHRLEFSDLPPAEWLSNALRAD